MLRGVLVLPAASHTNLPGVVPDMLTCPSHASIIQECTPSLPAHSHREHKMQPASSCCTPLPAPVLQVTAFVALLSLDVRRLEQHRMDCLPCLILRPASQPLHAPRSYGGCVG